MRMNIVYKSATHTRLLRKMTCVKPFRALVIIIKKNPEKSMFLQTNLQEKILAVTLQIQRKF